MTLGRAALLFVAWLAASALAAPDAAQERNLGLSYYTGVGVPRDPAKAVEHLSRAVELGDAESAVRLGRMYEQGTGGIARNDAEATRWYARGAELGDMRAQFEAGLRYYNGAGVARDPVEAVKWWTLSLQQPGSPESRRDYVETAERRLKPDEIARGRELAQAWLARRAPSPARTGP